jgi:ribonuclease P/MRP protein subunit RPP20
MGMHLWLPFLFLTIMNVSKKRKADTDHGQRVKRSKGVDGTHHVEPGKSAGKMLTEDGADTLSKPSLKNAEGSAGTSKRSRPKGKGKATNATESTSDQTPIQKPKHKLRKLAAPRPFPTVPTSVSATGPRSAHKEGKNYICLTRKTPLAAYLRRCKEVFMKDGYAPACSIISPQITF